MQRHKIRAYSIISSQRASIFLRWLFGQPGFPQSLLVSRQVFGTGFGGEGAFLGCTGLSTVSLPASLNEFGPGVFAACTSLGGQGR